MAGAVGAAAGAVTGAGMGMFLGTYGAEMLGEFGGMTGAALVGERRRLSQEGPPYINMKREICPEFQNRKFICGFPTEHDGRAEECGHQRDMQ